MCVCVWQELEIQARAHGLTNMATSMGGVELSPHLLKQQHQTQVTPQSVPPPLYPQDDLSSQEYIQRTSLQAAVGIGNAGDPNDSSTTFSDPLSHFTDFFSSSLKEEQRLDEILMDDALSPFGTDPLLSAGSPAASKGSSRRSSFSSEETDELWPPGPVWDAVWLTSQFHWITKMTEDTPMLSQTHHKKGSLIDLLYSQLCIKDCLHSNELHRIITCLFLKQTSLKELDAG